MHFIFWHHIPDVSPLAQTFPSINAITGGMHCDVPDVPATHVGLQPSPDDLVEAFFAEEACRVTRPIQQAQPGAKMTAVGVWVRRPKESEPGPGAE